MRVIFKLSGEEVSHLGVHQQALTAASQALLDGLAGLEQDRAWQQHVDYLFNKLSVLVQAMQVGIETNDADH